MSVKAFIPEVWSAKMNETLHKQLVFGALCSRRWEGDIAAYGDTVHIGSVGDITVRSYSPNTDIADPEQLDAVDRTLTIDHGAYYHFFLNDVDAAQSRADIMEAAIDQAAVKLAEDAESYILSVIRAGAGVRLSGTLPDSAGGGVYSLIVHLKEVMDLHHVPRSGRRLIVPCAVESELLLDSRFITGSGAYGNSRLTEGSVARAAGFDIYVSTDLTNEIVAMTEEGVAFASQLCSMEAYRREKGFGDGVKGLSLCGAKVVQPDCVCLYTITGGQSDGAAEGTIGG